MLLKFEVRWLRDEERSLEHIAAHRMLCFSPMMSRTQHNRPSPPAALNDFLAQWGWYSFCQSGRSWKLPHNNVYTYEIQQSNASAAIYRHFTLGSLAFDQISRTKKWEMLMKVSKIVSFVGLISKDSYLFSFFAIKNNKEKQHIHSVRNWNQ